MTATGESLNLPLWTPAKSDPGSGGSQCEGAVKALHSIKFCSSWDSPCINWAANGQISSRIQIAAKCVCVRYTLNVALSGKS